MSWLDNIKAKVVGQKILSLSFTTADNSDEWKILAMSLEVSDDGNIEVEEKWELLSLGQLEEWLAEHKYLPLVLGVESHEVLMRKIEGQESEKKQLLQSIVPQAKQEDFFLQALQEPDHLFVSIIRKESWQRILELIPKSNVVVGAYLGPVAKAILAKGLDGETVALGDVEIIKRENNVTQVVPLQTAKLVPEILDSGIGMKEVLAYAVGVSYLSGISIVNDFQVKTQQEELFHQIFFHRYAKFGLAAVLVVFLANTLFFLELSKDNEQWQDQISSLNATQKKVEEYHAFVTRHGDLINGLNETYFTQLADELGASVPSGISLQLVEVMPLYLQEKGNQLVSQKVLISGTAANATVYTQWIETIKKFSWTETIDKNTYRAVPNGKEGVFQLEVLLVSNV